MTWLLGEFYYAVIIVGVFIGNSELLILSYGSDRNSFGNFYEDVWAISSKFFANLSSGFKYTESLCATYM